jgi:hypothetical protein
MARTLTRGAAALTIAGGILLAWGGPGTSRIAEVKAEATKTVYVAAGADVSRAIATAQPGSTIVLSGGSYPALTAPAGTRSAPVTVAAAAGQTVTMPSVNVPNGASNLRFDGVNLTGDGSGPAFNIGDNAHDIQLVNSKVFDTGDAIIVRPGVSNVLFENNDISSRAPGATNGGIALAFASTSTLPGSPPGQENDPPISNVTIRNNTFHDIGSDAIRPSNFVNLVVEGNDFSGVKENGDHCDVFQVTFGGRDLIFRDNYIHDNQGQGLFIKDGQVTNARVENNVFVHNSLEITVQFYDTINLQLINNTVWDNAANVQLRQGIRNVLVRNNLFQDLTVDSTSEAAANVTQDYNVIAGGNWGARGPHDIKGSPKFVNPAGYDYRLAAASPGIDAGNADGAPTFDKACRPRFDAPDANKGVGNPAYVDMGALEYQPTSAAGDTAARFNPACAGTGPPGGAPTPTCCASSKTAKCTWLTVGKPRRHGSIVRIRVVPRRTGTVAFAARVVWQTSKGARRADVRSTKLKLKTGKARTVRLKLGPKARRALARNKSARLALAATGSGASACKLSRTLAVKAG